MSRGERPRVITRGSTLLLTIGTLLVLIYPVTASADFLIRLKNGGELRTSQYWEEANRIMFYASGGVLGIQKSLVKDIKVVESEPAETGPEPKEDKALLKDMTAEQPGTESPSVSSSQDAQVPSKKVAQTSSTENVNVSFASYRDRKRELREKIDQASMRYQETTDPEAKEQARLDILAFTRQTYELAEEVKQKTGGILPDWWGQ